MEVLIAILWYLQIFFVDVSYTTHEVDNMIIDNQDAIEAVHSDNNLTNQIVNDYNTKCPDGTTNVVETWEEEPEPILD